MSSRQRSRPLGSKYLLGLCVSVAAVFLGAGQLLFRGARDLADKAEEQLATELLSLCEATERNVLNVVNHLELLASQPVMLWVFDEDLDFQIFHTLKLAAEASGHFVDIDCLDAELSVVASTGGARLGSPSELVSRRSAELLVSGVRAVVRRRHDGMTFLVPIDAEDLDEAPRIGYLLASVRQSELLPGHDIEWVALIDQQGEVVTERGDRPQRLGRSPDETKKERVVIRSEALRFPNSLVIDPLSVWVATPFNTLFGRSISLKSKVLWVWMGSAVVLGLLMLTFSRLELRYSRRVARHARELEHKNEALRLSEKELRHQTQLAEAASRAKSEFLATVSHELRTPMNAILGMNGLILETQLDAEQVELAQTVHGSADSLLSIINDILDFSSLDGGEVHLDAETVDLRSLTETTVATVQTAADEKRLELRWHLDPSVPPFFSCDPGRLRRVLLHLLGNALKFTEHGWVELRALSDGTDGGGVRIRFEVEDTGIGVHQGQSEVLFQAFSQVETAHNRRFGGTGMGLAICKQLVECMGGEIGVRSLPGVGSTFWFTVPVTRVESPAPAEEAPVPATPVAEKGRAKPKSTTPSPEEPPMTTDRPKVLIAEDNRVNQRLIRRLVEKLGLATELAENGREALQAFGLEDYALILMDIQMPEMDGLEATRRIRASARDQERRTPIIAVTANTTEEDRERGFSAGMDDYLGKPVRPAQLAETIQKWLDRDEAGMA